jgi:hypothetical protein
VTSTDTLLGDADEDPDPVRLLGDGLEMEIGRLEVEDSESKLPLEDDSVNAETVCDGTEVGRERFDRYGTSSGVPVAPDRWEISDRLCNGAFLVAPNSSASATMSLASFSSLFRWVRFDEPSSEYARQYLLSR